MERTTTRRNESGQAAAMVLLAGAVGGVIAGALCSWLFLQRRVEPQVVPAGAAPAGTAAATVDLSALDTRLASFERAIAGLEAQQRTLASVFALAQPAAGGDHPEPAPSTAARPASASAGALAGKPVDEIGAAARRREASGNDAMARAIEHAALLPESLRLPATPRSSAITRAADLEPVDPAGFDSTTGSDLGEGDADAPATAPAPDAEAVIVAFNQLLRDAGLERWSLLSAEARPAERALAAVVLAERGVKGTAVGSLSADRLQLARDPVTGVAAFTLTGAHGLEDGVEVAYEGAATTIEIPGILPVELLPALLQSIFGIGVGGETAAAPLDQATVLARVNRVLGLETGITLRFRALEKLEDERFKKVVIDLAFDESGAATQSVVADEAWFEITPGQRRGELCCEGGEMVEKGQKRPLYHGHLRVPLRDLTPERWKGVPSVKVIVGS